MFENTLVEFWLYIVLYDLTITKIYSNGIVFVWNHLNNLRSIIHHVNHLAIVYIKGAILFSGRLSFASSQSCISSS